MKWICLPIVYAVILSMIAWFALQLVGCSDFRSRSYEDMKKQAEVRIKEVGGASIVEKEAKTILNNLRAGSDRAWHSISEKERKYPAISKLQALLSPYGHDFWVVEDKKNLPAHVVIRFGSHSHYAYVWIFDSEHVPLGKIEGMEHLSGAVYLSERNQ